VGFGFDFLAYYFAGAAGAASAPWVSGTLNGSVLAEAPPLLSMAYTISKYSPGFSGAGTIAWSAAACL
jgi:hypothetical protein